MRTAVIKDGIVINVILTNPGEELRYAEDNVSFVYSESANIGDSYVDGNFIPPK